MSDLRNDIYTENDIKENIDNGNIYIEPNIRGTLSIVKEFESHPVDSEWLIGFGTLSIDLTLAHEQTENYLYFKDGSYIRAVLKPTWTEGPLQLVTVIAYEAFFGIKQDDGTITEIRYISATGLPGYKTKYIWEVDETSPSGGEWVFDRNINYMVGDKFNISLGWWDDGIPKSRSFFIVKTAGGGAYNYEDYTRFINPNILSSGLQLPVYYDTAGHQEIAAYLSGNKTEGTEYPGEDSEAGGGDGTFYNVNDDIDFTPIPNIQTIDFGFNTIYNPREADMRAISDWLWSGDYTDSVKLNQISPMENILNIAIVALPASKIHKELAGIKIAGISSGIQSRKVTNQYVELDCGTLPVSEYWGGFLDYNANFSIWLPYIGFRSLKPDDILRGDLTVRYIIDLLTGAAVCEIRSILPDPQIKNKFVKHILYSYNCNVFYNIAISCSNYMNMYNQQFNATVSGISNFVNSVAQIGGSLATGNVVGALNGALNMVSGGAQAKQAYDSAKPEFGRGGNSGGNSGFFSAKRPYIVRSQPKEQAPKNYAVFQGIPAEIFAKLSTLYGYTEVSRVITDTLVHCTAEEKTSILGMLSSGVYL